MTQAPQGKGVWCVAELRHGALVPVSFELLTAGRQLADALAEPLCAVVLGGPGRAQEAAKALAARGADKAFVLEHPLLEAFLEETHAQALRELIERERPNKLLFAATALGRPLSARLSVLCRAALAPDAVELSLDANRSLVAVRPCYAGNLLSTVGLRRGPQMASLRPMAWPRAEASGRAGEIAVAPVDPSRWQQRVKFLGFTPEESKEIDLSSAEKIVSGGRGLGNPQGFELIRELARALGAAVGASRATVDAGWIPYRHQVGLTGRTVRPRLYMACGISGQIQHLAGMSSSDVVVAVNTDPECPMMKLANFAVEGDLYQILPALIAEIKRQRGDSA